MRDRSRRRSRSRRPRNKSARREAPRCARARDASGRGRGTRRGVMTRREEEETRRRARHPTERRSRVAVSRRVWDARARVRDVSSIERVTDLDDCGFDALSFPPCRLRFCDRSRTGSTITARSSPSTNPACDTRSSFVSKRLTMRVFPPTTTRSMRLSTKRLIGDARADRRPGRARVPGARFARLGDETRAGGFVVADRRLFGRHSTRVIHDGVCTRLFL